LVGHRHLCLTQRSDISDKPKSTLSAKLAQVDPALARMIDEGIGRVTVGEHSGIHLITLDEIAAMTPETRIEYGLADFYQFAQNQGWISGEP
jgi:hypothetical protein